MNKGDCAQYRRGNNCQALRCMEEAKHLRQYKSCLPGTELRLHLLSHHKYQHINPSIGSKGLKKNRFAR
jgi:hypothetical protein